MIDAELIREAERRWDQAWSLYLSAWELRSGLREYGHMPTRACVWTSSETGHAEVVISVPSADLLALAVAGLREHVEWLESHGFALAGRSVYKASDIRLFLSDGGSV